MLRKLKLACMRAAQELGLNHLLLESRWRQQRLLILCYHGLALEDEHEWRPNVYLAQATFRERMQLLVDLGCAVLPLGRAIHQMYAGSLPKKAVAITFDDGGYDFYRLAHPILSGFGFPATLYLTTYYTLCNRPVFDVMLSYLLWKGNGRRLSLPGFLAEPVVLSPANSAVAEREIRRRARGAGLSAAEKDELLTSVAAALAIDYRRLCSRRIHHLMNAAELRELASAGLDIQLHTHRHRVPQRRELFLKEIEDNRNSIGDIAGTPCTHFCYPCGIYLREFGDYLQAAAVESAATCDLGLAGRRSHRLFLPRVLDAANVTPAEFVAWTSGLAGLLPRRPHPPLSKELFEELAPAG